MQIQMTKISEIKPYFQNSKKHPEEQIRKIAMSIQEFGWGQPIAVDKNGTIIVGHGRYEACLLLKLEEAPCVVLDISEEKARAYRIADNKLNESEWDNAMLKNEFLNLEDEVLINIGFTPVEIQTIRLSEDALGTEFTLPDGDKGNLEQITFTLSREQAEIVRGAMDCAKDEGDFLTMENFGNENANGNALFYIVKTWKK
jgi:ParB-like chromosome segregation protein Spo0J